MKKLILITLSILLFSCGQSSNNQENNDSNNNESQTIEEFKEIDTTGLSERLSHGNKRLTAQEVMR